MTSCLYVGYVRHRRLWPRDHAFKYASTLFYLDLDEVAGIARRVPIFGLNRTNLVAFWDRDHLDGGGDSTLARVRWFLLRHGIDTGTGPIGLLTQCRVLGYVFNPISLFYCHRPDGTLAAVVAEVNNTFGERYLYLLEETLANGDPARPLRTTVRKAMHVSPFIGMDATYDFQVGRPGEYVTVGIVEHEGGRRVLDAEVWGRRVPLTTGTLSAMLVRRPWTTVKVIAGIHFEALRLHLKGVRHHRQPRASADQHRQAALLAERGVGDPRRGAGSSRASSR